MPIRIVVPNTTVTVGSRLSKPLIIQTVHVAVILECFDSKCMVLSQLSEQASFIQTNSLVRTL